MTPSAARSLVTGSKLSGSRRSSSTLLSREPLRTVLLAGSIGQAKVCLAASDTSSGVNGWGERRRPEPEDRLLAVVRVRDRFARGPDRARGPGRDRSRAPPAARSSAHRVAICDPLPGGGVLEL